jgi:transcription initiation factor TFIID subunit TAF12
LTVGKTSSQRQTFPVPNCPTRIPHPVVWERTRAFVETGLYVQRYGQKIPKTCTDPQYVYINSWKVDEI